MKKIILLLLIFVFTSPAYAIKIGLQDNVKSTYIGTSNDGQILNGRNQKVIFLPKSRIPYTIKAYKKKIAIKIKNRYYDLATDYIVVRSSQNGYVATKKRWYRGDLIVYNLNGKLTVVNSLPMELYIQGVVPAEMPSNWNYEAHKAQAIAARSYAMANLRKRASRGYDLRDTPHDQAYGGASAETEQTNRAVQATRGVVLTYNNNIIPAYYHAASGGHTVNSGIPWTHDLPYIKAVPGFDEGIRKNGHGVGMSQYGANNLAKKGYNAYQILNYFYNNIKFAVLKSDF